PNIVLTYPTEKQQEMMEEFSVRAERIRNGLVDPSNDNMLKLLGSTNPFLIRSALTLNSSIISCRFFA
ncbi:hypothetical protein DRJ90_16115, partial [Enterococcus faecalis]|uniref:hypothetical protein n=1 Tax=Enterococcus faecalis TaxID=1351 RepID=UPI001003904A